MPNARDCIVMFADINDSVGLYERHGDRIARALVTQCLQRLRGVTQDLGGRTVRSTGDGILATFETADAALGAACEMHKAVAEMDAPPDVDFRIRIGCHYGSMAEVEGDMYGDAVNLAKRIADLAQPGQIKTTAETVTRLSPPLQAQLRCIGPLTVKGKRRPAMIYEFVGTPEQELTLLRAEAPAAVPTTLLLRGAAAEYVLSDSSPTTLSIGRSEEHCDIVVQGGHASRRHARIEMRGLSFVLIDQSANGTHVIPEGGEEIVLRHQEFTLHGQGKIYLGCGPEAGEPPVEYLVRRVDQE
jgi:adenylate cyclase